MLAPFLPIANDKFSSLTIANASFFIGSVIVTIASLAGLKAFLIYSAGSALYRIISTFSPFNSFKIEAILEPRSPIHAPIASIFSFVDSTATLLLTPASRATACNHTVPSANSGISDSNNLFTNP
jgi:hypothetical protein